MPVITLLRKVFFDVLAKRLHESIKITGSVGLSVYRQTDARIRKTILMVENKIDKSRGLDFTSLKSDVKQGLF